MLKKKLGGSSFQKCLIYEERRTAAPASSGRTALCFVVLHEKAKLFSHKLFELSFQGPAALQLSFRPVP